MLIEIKKMVAELLEIDLNSIDDNFSANDNANWDSLMLLNLTAEIEEKFGVSIEPEDIPELTSIELIQNCINKYKQN